MTPTTDLKAALISASGRKIKHKGRTWKLSAEEVTGKFYPYPVFSADALNLTPQTADERKFCYWDLWKSDGDDAAELLFKFAKLGGYIMAR